MTVKEDKAESAEEEQEWLRQSSVIYAGLIGVGVVMVQPFLTAESLDMPAKISVIAFSVAIPLLAALIMVNQQESFRRRATGSVIVTITSPIAQMCAFAGVVAAFWHILWIAGVAILVSGMVAVGVHSAGYARLERRADPSRSSADSRGEEGTG